MIKNILIENENDAKLSSDPLDIDQIDKQIIKLLIENPDVTHEEIAIKVNRSQPAVGARILKLKKKQLIANQVGVNYKTAGLKLAFISFSATNPVVFKEYLHSVPQFIQSFKTLGTTNFMVLVAGKDLNDIDAIVETYIRSHDDVSNISMNVLIESLNDLVLPFYFEEEAVEPTPRVKSAPVEETAPEVESSPELVTPFPRVMSMRDAVKKMMN